MKPLLKWVGGKQRLVDEIVKRMPKKYGRYYEPFAGGAALFFHLEPENAFLADTNGDLIAMYKAVTHVPEDVIAELAKLKRRHSPAAYYRIRERWNTARATMDPARAAAMFIYLNRTCFNGLWRVNADGHFNVPIGKYVNPAIHNPALVRAASKVLLTTSLQQQPFDVSCSWAQPGDFVYFDPPYDPISATSSFTGYAKAGFGAEMQAKLADEAHALSSRGVHVMLSNNNTPLIRKLYPRGRWKHHRVKISRPINSKADGRGDVVELIITSY